MFQEASPKNHMRKPMPPKPIAAGKSSFDLIDFSTFLSAMDLGDDVVLLDAACGAGRYAVEIARQARSLRKIYAFDLWAEGITRLKLKAGSLGLENIDAAVCDVSQTIPIDDASVDVCLMATVLHDLIKSGTHAGTLAQVRRVLAPDGRLAVVEFKKMPGPPGPPEKMRLSPQDLETVLAPLGFCQRGTVELGPVTYLSIFQR